jgi:hypothetical protein
MELRRWRTRLAETSVPTQLRRRWRALRSRMDRALAMHTWAKLAEAVR